VTVIIHQARQPDWPPNAPTATISTATYPKIVVYVAAIEMVLHGWDITQACKTDSAIPADLASALIRLAPPLADAGLAEHMFAKPVEVSTTASPSDQLLALFGRHPRVHQTHVGDL
jgi:hypothetical protein